jgi:hypothetical protein
MYCPRCGQQQISNEIKFCSRCGFPLTLVTEVLENGGFLPQLAELSKKGKLPDRKTGLKIGLVWFLLLLFILTPLFAIADIEELAAASAVLGFMGGALMMIFSLLFLKKENPLVYDRSMIANENIAPQFLSGKNRQTALPPQQTQPAESYMPPAGHWKAPETGDLVPHSVTDNTTKLLNKEE